MAGLAPGMATGPAKLKTVRDLVARLTKGLSGPSLPPQEQIAVLEELKLYGRDPSNAGPIFTEEGISMLLRYGFDDTPKETSQAALRVLANSMLLRPETRQIFVDQGFAPKASEKLKTDSFEDEFLISRVLLFSTYGTGIDLAMLLQHHDLAANVTRNIHRHAQRLNGSSKAKVEPMEEMALAETLRLTFNITHFCKESAALFAPAVPDLVDLLWKEEPLLQRPLDGPVASAINALLNMNLQAEGSTEALFPLEEPAKVLTRLVQILQESLSVYSEGELEATTTPLVSLLCKIHQHAPALAQKYLRKALLPTAEDRELVLGQGDALSSKMLKNTTNPLAPHLGDALSHLLFDLSDRDASKFVENIGYGYASGFLIQNNIAIPASASEELAGESSRPVNPVTGQFIHKEKDVDLPKMTQEEKEREAERLFVLFDRLKKTGVVNVMNPVEKAFREGQFRELDDVDVEELD